MLDINLIINLGSKVLAGKEITCQEAVALSEISNDNLPFLLAMADKIRQKYQGAKVDLCTIVNARSGKCSEDCTYCAQSVHHQTNINIYNLLAEDTLVKEAKKAAALGAKRFSIVTSGPGGEKDNDFTQIIQALRRIKVEIKLELCASLGALTFEKAQELKRVGVTRYHHNIETSPSYYPNICTTHNYKDRINTINIAKRAGLSVCSGGIIGLGEGMQDRINMAFELKGLEVESIPLNILNPIKGTRLEQQKVPNPKDILKTFALFRFILPTKILRTAGGRELNLRDLQALALVGGMNGMIIGGYLTTGGRSTQDDLRMLKDLELEV